MTSVLLVVAVISTVSGFILERRLMVRDMQTERREWANERGSLLDRIKPETSQPPLHGPEAESFQAPVTDEEFWAAREN